ncbi:MAG: 2-polyprenyl-3-methyl-5-hydroxy-6-metoxy-1,4-benzoquinol methylase [Chloroflexi bacterium]|jgi:SAM-dependent methyltransferase|nr:MAG: 2-polyprenyl-3-methyl-5-hydroxy-6-metoxy-1,4-benzoquinol methylase [Chloroflexota bacterium]
MGGEEPAGDFWVPHAHRFVADPRRTDDPEVARLSQLLDPGDSLLDVGGGAGRLALPLALTCRHATVVEPSSAMVKLLLQSATEAGIDNITAIQENWEDVEVLPADVVLCAHVVYGDEDIEGFIAKMTANARKSVAILLYFSSPQTPISPFWSRVHHEERVHLPAVPELLTVLWEMGIFPDVEMLRTIETKPL